MKKPAAVATEQEAIAEIGAEVRARREALHLTRPQACEASGLGLQTLIRIEAGSPGVAVVNLMKIAGVLGLNFGLQSKQSKLASGRAGRAGRTNLGSCAKAAR